MQEVNLEYIFHTSPKIIFKQISTPSGLTGWFAEDVVIEGDVYIFKWGDYQQEAKVILNHKEFYVRFDWLEDKEKFTEIRLVYNRLSKDTSMQIKDMTDDGEDEREDLIKLWDETIKRLKLRLGLPPKLLK